MLFANMHESDAPSSDKAGKVILAANTISIMDIAAYDRDRLAGIICWKVFFCN